MMEVHMLIALIVLIVLAVVVLTGIILSLVAGLRPVPRFNPRLLFPTVPRNDFSGWYGRSPRRTACGIPAGATCRTRRPGMGQASRLCCPLRG
jgi:hypothetical protein